jgi:hypothetical protein
MKKFEKDGEIAIVYNNCLGKSSFYDYEERQEYKQLRYHPVLVEAVLSQDFSKITKEWMMQFPDFWIDAKSLKDLSIKWVQKGLKFTVREEDGLEEVITEEDLDFIA